MTLRQMREASALTQQQVADASGLTQASISALELGKHSSPRLDTLQTLAAAYGVTLDELVAAVRETVAEAAA
jgi:transcriptional regulator with XRE-family HTH domain